MLFGINSIKIMIKDNKKLNPFIGIAIGVFLIFFGIFGILFLFGDKLSEDLYMLTILPFVIIGTFFPSEASKVNLQTVS